MLVLLLRFESLIDINRMLSIKFHLINKHKIYYYRIASVKLGIKLETFAIFILFKVAINSIISFYTCHKIDHYSVYLITYLYKGISIKNSELYNSFLINNIIK